MRRAGLSKMPIDVRRRLTVIAVCAVLAVLVFVAFGQAIHYGFVNYDDPRYVYQNPMVSRGLSWAGVEWAFTHVLVGHWHPLTFMLFMLDCRFFGLWAGGHHLVNIILHAACAVLLFLALLEMTGALWRSAFVAALFAIHPLRVESVVWISEMKDVLSGLFFMLTIWTYAKYVKHPGSAFRYAMVLIWFALGLLSKPMLVTVPCVLLLLDYWPLGRLRGRAQFAGLLWEKTPFFVLSALSSIATVFALGKGSGGAPISSHPANAPIAYVAYLGKFIYPIHLTVLYPLPVGGSPPWEVMDSVLLLALLTAGAWYLRQRKPYLLTGWLWYLGMLVPVIGVMQTGEQAYADRYTYLPQIGLGFACTWAIADWARNQMSRCVILGSAAAAVLTGLLALSWHQTTYWRDTATLWAHALECTRDNYLAHDSLGDALVHEGRFAEAVVERRKALQINPTDAGLHNNLGYTLYREGLRDQAVAEYLEALRLDPAQSGAHTNLGDALLQKGDIAAAVAQYREAIRIDPEQAQAHNNLGCALFQQNRMVEGMAECREAIRIDPGYADAYVNLGNALLQLGRPAEAADQYRAALQIDPANAGVQKRLASATAQAGDKSR